MVMINPPYGERLEVENISAMYKEIGDCLKNHFHDCKAFIISSDIEALKNVGLAAYKKKTVFNGPLECKLLGYELYKGRRS